jgi:hypothetical protein
MFIKRNRSRQGGREYQSVLLVRGRRVAVARGPGRPSRDAPAPRTRVVHETVANLTALPEDLIGLIADYCAGKPAQGEHTRATQDAALGSAQVSMGPCYGVLAGLQALARHSGLVAALGPGREAKLALFLICARVARQGSRLASVRWAEDHAVMEALGLERFDEDDLYAALEWLSANQPRIEKALAAKCARGAVFFYDVTSSYFEGQHNELAAHGYNRDGKPYKKQVVAGLLTDAAGEPLSIRLYQGNTADPATFKDAVARLREDFGARKVVMIGDRGMIKTAGIKALTQSELDYVTALTNPQIRKLIEQKTITPELFDQTPVEVAHEGRRLVLRLNPQTRERDRTRRASQQLKIEQRLEQGNQLLARSTRAKVETLVKKTELLIKLYGFGKWLQIRTEGRRVSLHEDKAARARAELLDGCYVLVTTLEAQSCAASTIWERYLGLQQVERDFRTMKTGQLEIRPIFLRKEERTRGHALVTMLALKLVRRLDALIAPLGLTVDDAIDRLAGVRLVGLGAPRLKLWRLPDSYQPAQQEILAALPALAAPLLSLEKPIKRRLKNPRKHRSSPL